MAQSGTDEIQGAETESNPLTGSKSMRWFFVCMACLLLVIVAVGFAPSFYLPNVLLPELAATGKLTFPAYIVLHGVVLSLWYLLLFIQALLVTTKRVHIHRRLGIAGAALAAVLVPLSLFVVTRSVARSNLGALPVIGDYGLLVLFATLVTVGIRFRRKPEVHKRLMLIASISIAAPAIVRWPGAESALPFSFLVPQLTMFAAIIVHDIVALRRVHPATLWGVAAYLVVVGVCVPLAFSPLGQQLLKSLK